MAASSTPDETVRTITVPVVQGSETINTIRFYEAGVDAKSSQVLFWANKDLLEQLGADNVEHLTLAVTAVKTKPGVVVTPPIEPVEQKPA